MIATAFTFGLMLVSLAHRWYVFSRSREPVVTPGAAWTKRIALVEARRGGRAACGRRCTGFSPRGPDQTWFSSPRIVGTRGPVSGPRAHFDC